MVPLKTARRREGEARVSMSVMILGGERGRGSVKKKKKFTHDFHAGDAFAHRFDLTETAGSNDMCES
jgi:hypothetical protein